MLKFLLKAGLAAAAAGIVLDLIRQNEEKKNGTSQKPENTEKENSEVKETQPAQEEQSADSEKPEQEKE